MEQEELFDVILNNLTEKGYIHTWKSELMYWTVKPLYESGVLKRIKLKSDNETEVDQRRLLKFRLLLDFLDKLGLEKTKQMLMCELEADKIDLNEIIPELTSKMENEQETYLGVLFRMTDNRINTSTTMNEARASGSPPKYQPDRSQDFFVTATDIKIDETL